MLATDMYNVSEGSNRDIRINVLAGFDETLMRKYEKGRVCLPAVKI